MTLFYRIQMDELAKLLRYKINQLANHSVPEEPEWSAHQRALSAQEVTSAFINSERKHVYDRCIFCRFVKLLNMQ